MWKVHLVANTESLDRGRMHYRKSCFVMYIYEKNSNVCMAKSGTRGRLANWNSGWSPAGVVSPHMKV